MTPDIPPPDLELLDGLTKPQHDAVTHVDGPLLVLAGPGSGKTRVVTCRIAYLVLGVGVPPEQILAITFTNKAAAEMRQRVGMLIPDSMARRVTASTFHSFCARVLRRFGEHLDLAPGYSIYDTADQTRAVKQALEDLEMSTTNFQPASVLSSISQAKNALQDADAAAGAASDYYDRQVARVYQRYTQILAKNQALDFDDLLLTCVQLMRQHENVLQALRQRFRYVLVDEYQDTNHAQFVLAHGLAGGHRNLCVTGDPDQSIYSWRGADIRNILEFEQQYPDARVVRLEQNYRSTGHILAAADALIQNNTRRKHKALWTDNEKGEPVHVFTCQQEQDEAMTIVRIFRDLRDREGFGWSDFAVFYRVNALSRVMEEVLLRAGVPYQIARGTAFYDRKEIKDAIAYLRVIANPRDEVNLLRIINTPARGISAATVRMLTAAAAQRNTSLIEVCQQVHEVSTLSTRATQAVTAFTTLLQSWCHACSSDTAALFESTNEVALPELVQSVVQSSGIETFYRNDKKDPEQERLANLGELISAAMAFQREVEDGTATDPEQAPMTSTGQILHGFLERISLVSDVDAVDAEQGAVTLMTLHAAKGLEFPAVAVIGVEEGLLPHTQSQADPRQLEEERRLCFVGMTRARRYLAMSHTQLRTVFGQTQPSMRSRFLDELPDDDVDRGRSEASGTLCEDDPWLPDEDQRRDAEEEAGQFPPGTVVRHPRFGVGRVETIAATGMHAKARIAFERGGTKTLVLQYARLERV